MSVNLNTIIPYNNGTISNNIRVYFRNLKTELIKLIDESDMIIGAIAWITDSDILEHLANKETLLVIQKEDFLRPDMVSRLSDKEKLRIKAAYNKFRTFDGSHVSTGIFFQNLDNRFKHLAPILCFGTFNAENIYKSPRMHNKFLVFLHKKNNLFIPKKVWTGSLNLTKLSLNSLENAIVIEDEIIASAYADEAQLIYINGENLDWNTEWINPLNLKQNI